MLVPNLLASVLFATQLASAQLEVKHYGYSGQDKLLQCVQRVLGKYAAAFPNTVLYGHSPIIRRLPPKVVNGHWESVVDRVVFPTVSDLPCPGTREGILNLLQNDIAKLLLVPPGEPEGVRTFETPSWVYIIPASRFSEAPGTPDYPNRERWKRIRIETKVEVQESISEAEARSLVPEILKYARTVPLEPQQAVSPQTSEAPGVPTAKPKKDEEAEIDLRLRFSRIKLKPDAPESIVVVIDDWPFLTAGRLVYGELRDGKYEMLWDSPLLNGRGTIGFEDVNGDGVDEIVWNSAICGTQCGLQELVIFDKEGREITRQQHCNVPATSPFSESDGVCAIRGAEINIGAPLIAAGASHLPANIEVRNWETDGADHIFKLVNGKYESGSQLDRPESPEDVRSELYDLRERAAELMREGRYEEAAAKFEQAANLDNSISELANNAGFAYYKAKKYEKSAFWIEKAIQMDPKRAVAYLNLGDTLVKLQRNADARQAYKTYLELAPSSKSAADVKKKLDALH